MIKKALNLSVVIAGLLLFSCKGKNQNENLAETNVKKPPTISKTKIYKSRFTSIMDVIVTETLTLDLNEKGDGGEFKSSVIYPKGSMYEGEKLKNINSTGSFMVKESEKYGTIYVLNNGQPLENCFQVLDQNLNQLWSENGDMTGSVYYQINDVNTGVPISETREATPLSKEQKAENERLKKNFK
ncbi:hypothetical protein FA048_08085 [Pedobacter polaris]|uniref:Lipoprotein n=1 Tax=Pedobacter polaris TaxID=2571273 RepID=A0A4U1CQ10_9SPHI|nr:hypothetical protein [Pedobacter polaris]TKC10151.1 hypothetical protein FA048_08085 [Pedobacter polaris]